MRFHLMGANVTAIASGTKQPLHKWEPLKHERQTTSDLSTLDWNEAGGLGFVSGINGWRLLELDKCPTFAPVATLLQRLGLPQEYPWVWKTGSGNGWAIAFLCDEDIAETFPGILSATDAEAPGVFWGMAKSSAFDHLELRWSGCQSLLPPSRHPSGPGYQWRHDPPTAPPATVSAGNVLSAFLTVAEPRVRAARWQKSSDYEPRDTEHPLECLKAAWRVLDVFQHHGLASNERVERDGSLRLLGNGGLLIHPGGELWYCFADEAGGDVIDAWGYCEHGTLWNRHNPELFKEAAQQMAQEAGITLPGFYGKRDLDPLIDTLQTWVLSEEWPIPNARTRTTDRKTMTAVLERMRRADSLVVALSCRDGADFAGMGWSTAAKSLKRLCDAGLLERVDDRNDLDAATYTLPEAIENMGREHTLNHSFPQQQPKCVASPHVVRRYANHPLFLHAARLQENENKPDTPSFGPVLLEIVAVLASGGEFTLTELAEATGANRKTVREKIKAAKSIGLVVLAREGRSTLIRLVSKWQRVLDRVIPYLTTATRTAKRVVSHISDRIRQTFFLERFHPDRYGGVRSLRELRAGLRERYEEAQAALWRLKRKQQEADPANFFDDVLMVAA